LTYRDSEGRAAGVVDIMRTVGQFAASGANTKTAIAHARQTLSNSRDLVVR
jgi:hypothetical protein